MIDLLARFSRSMCGLPLVLPMIRGGTSAGPTEPLFVCLNSECRFTAMAAEDAGLVDRLLGVLWVELPELLDSDKPASK